LLFGGGVYFQMDEAREIFEKHVEPPSRSSLWSHLTTVS